MIRIFLLLLLLPLLYVGGVILYATLTDYQPPETEAVKIEGEGVAEIESDSLSFLIWNIGFCGLGEESDFFYDGGTHVRMSKKIVEKNLDGITDQIRDWNGRYDFFLLQEVDRSSRRSYRTNQIEKISDELTGYSSAFGPNYKVGFIPIPLTNPLGGVFSGVASWSKYKPAEALRYSFEGNFPFPKGLFFLDRCFLLERFPLKNGKELVVINTHNSAYDDGTLKKRQMEQMKAVLIEEYRKGNYVVTGGDWNQFPFGYEGVNGFTPPDRTGSFAVPEIYPESGWQWVWDPGVATNRALIKPYKSGETQVQIIDFFLLSPNVEVKSCKAFDLDFGFSDHQPVSLQLRLIPESDTTGVIVPPEEI